jgi:hypothetical protein
MYDTNEDASRNMTNRRDRFRVKIRKEKLNELFRARRDALFDPEYAEWRAEQKGGIELFKLAAEGI